MIVTILVPFLLAQTPPDSKPKPLPFRPLFVGMILAEDGIPIPGVSIFTSPGKLRKGKTEYCPYATNEAGDGTGNHCHWCQPDRGTRSVTNKDGRFKVGSLDPDRDILVAFSAEGYEPIYSTSTDPTVARVGRRSMVMRWRDPAGLEPGKVFRGRLVNPQGKPVRGAGVLVLGSKTTTEGLTWDTSGIDKMTSSNEQGEFVIRSQTPRSKILVRVRPRNLATNVFEVASASESIPEFQLLAGATVSGMVVRDGEVVAFAPVGLVQVDRFPATFVGNYETTTDGAGRFEFRNVAPNLDYHVFGNMAEFAKIGALPVTRVRVGTDGTQNNVGPLEVKPAHRISGRVILTDGKAVPPMTRLLVYRIDAWDIQTVDLDPWGRFELTGLPSETYGIAAHISGYRTSAKNPNMDPIDAWQLIGRIDRDITGFTYLMEPGSTLLADREFHKKTPEEKWPRNLPLRSAEFEKKE